jgi:translocator protein
MVRCRTPYSSPGRSLVPHALGIPIDLSFSHTYRGSLMTWHDWYDALAKPTWTPDPSSISLIWSLLYPGILLSFGFVFLQSAWGRLPRSAWLPFAVNLFANLAFMPLFAGLRDIHAATADILLVWGSLIWCAVAIWPYHRWVAIVQVPYFVWVSIAGVLQLSIAWMNW